MWMAIVCYDDFAFSRVEGSYEYSFIVNNMLMHHAVKGEIIRMYVRNESNTLQPYLQYGFIWEAIQDFFL